MSESATNGAAGGIGGSGPDKADPLWTGVAPSPTQQGVGELERIMWGRAGLPPSEEEEKQTDVEEVESPPSVVPSECDSAASDDGDVGQRALMTFASGETCVDNDNDVGWDPDETEGGVSLSLIVWKKRSGLGAFSQGYVRNAWERRRLVVVGNKLLYYSTFEEEQDEDRIKMRPRGILDLVEKNCSVEVVDPASDGAPAPFEVDIVSEDKEIRWKFCFETPEQLMDLLNVTQSLLTPGNDHAVGQHDPELFDHRFEAGDHIYRWEMIIFPPVIYPIQIHGIVLEAGRNCVIVADFGMTGYGKKEGSSFKHADDAEDHDLQDNLQAAWRKFRPNEDQRLNIVTMTDPKEIKKWFKASYGAGNLHSDRTKSKKHKMMGKISNVFHKSSSDAEHLERRALSTSLRTRSNTADRHFPELPTKPKQMKGNLTEPNMVSAAASKNAAGEDVPEWFDDNKVSGCKLGEPSVFSISKRDHSGHDDLPKSDPKEIVLARAHFLLEHGEEVLPPYHVFYSNSECIAVFCKTGRWSTLQTAVFLATNSVGGAKSSTLFTIGIAAAHAVLVPLAVVGGLIWVSAPMVILKKSREKWEESTMLLTDLFWSSAPSGVFVAAIEQWSDLVQDDDAADD